MHKLSILSILLISLVFGACQPKEVYVIEITNVRVADIKAHKLLIEGTVWFGNPTDQIGTQTELTMDVDINGLHYDQINTHFSMTTEFGPNKKWESPFQINIRNEKYFDEATITDILNHKVNKKLRIKGTGEGTFIMGLNNPKEIKVPFKIDKTFTIFPEDEVPLK